MKRILILMAVIFALLPLSSNVNAEVKPGSFTISPIIGAYVFGQSDHLKTSPVYSLRAGYNFTGNLGMEALFDYISTKYTIGDSDIYYGTNAIAYRYGLDLLYHFMPESRVVPYLAAGFGARKTDPDGLSTHTYGIFDYGAGLMFFITNNLALRADFRGLVFQNDGPVNNFEYTLGLGYQFGGNKTAPVPVLETNEDKVFILTSDPKAEETVSRLASESKEKVVILALEDIHFDFDKASLTEEAKAILKRNIRILNGNPKCKTRIAGYTSASSSNDYNQRLSEIRSKAVEEYLVDEGIVAPDRLSIIGYGKTRPSEPESAPDDIYSKEANTRLKLLFEVIMN
jgi:OmpA-OmpF porin, OOP family